MSIVEFCFKNVKSNIQCLDDEKLEDILKRFAVKIEKEVGNLYFIYGGKTLSQDLKNSTFNQIATKIDKERKKMTLLAYEINTNLDVEHNNLIKSKEIICPDCGENTIMHIKNYKINLSGCKNSHIINDLSIDLFDKTQIIDESKIECNNCKKNKADSYEKKFYICTSCQINLCPLCKLNHFKWHKIINYDDRNYICNIHNNEKYISYCKNCKKNICALCYSEHENHDKNNYKLPNKNIINDKINELRKKIDNINETIKSIIMQLNDFQKFIEKYYEIFNNIINNFDISNRNFEIIENINNLMNNDIIDDIDNIVKEKNIINKFNKIIEIYNKKNNITEEVFDKKTDNKISNIVNNIDKGNEILKEVEYDLEDESILYININESKKNINQKIKLIKSIEKKQKVECFCYLEKSNKIALGVAAAIDFYDLNFCFLFSYNVSSNVVLYISELMDGKILYCESSKSIYILKIKDKKIELYKKIETKDEFNFVGIEISNKKIICGGNNLSIIEPSYLLKYSLKKSKDIGPISNIVELDFWSFLIALFEEKKIIVFDNETYKPKYEIDDIEVCECNYGVAKISSDLVGICGTKDSNACLYILSIDKKKISSKLIIKEYESIYSITKLNNNFFMMTGKRKGYDKNSNFILLQKEIENNKFIIKKIYLKEDAYSDNIEGMISINDLIIALDSSAELKVWEVDTK